MSSLERRPNWSPANSASGGSPTLGSSSMPPNITAPKVQLYHALLSTTKHQKSRRTDILLWICRPPSLRYVLLLSILSPSWGLSLCAWEKETRKAEVLLGQWHSRPTALAPTAFLPKAPDCNQNLHTDLPPSLPMPSTCFSYNSHPHLLTF